MTGIYGSNVYMTGLIGKQVETMELRRDSVYLYDFTSYDQFVIDLEIIAEVNPDYELQYFTFTNKTLDRENRFV
ncbi:MAG: hypothetical protein CM15mP8_4550 [Methanobacteriota archaeon]|nr:MAG: hypothetical protein CM15mP8_4550 [Euryarchaeota archaeon]